ncbi:MAG: SIR2 family protein [Candidatus Dactylopiibacterium carminicum]|uniref:SIR2 family protein n=1 Tax=Candidatus Dactylopiibacterium carminicum TaxID=857335 RepID=A0A272EPU2_9RHOO|nr:SIR2 family protein [Candidatus Dactylopiibacterium carminicum]KAF7598392.1 SIR2 family protein [Candidatus Dactylopiibacterium carminicum]PAS92139.1 MAG: SIR2 family protein [Candidatus Dactylopiibacterium carminicum]PAS95566.1 MAG: SIR2 family protein [Candidatus Dactylopiibacterium carminicum]PAS97555.1 MAG: SIR2 family protein [Candidatus Dactylopiibacterium carminicum]
MDAALHAELIAGLKAGSIVPCLGPGVLEDVVSPPTQVRMPATSHELILGLNDGKPMSPKLMYEFSRAAMNIEHKRGRNAVNRFLTRTYAETPWSRSALHDWLKEIRPGYVIDINRDTQLLDSYAGLPHYLVQGCARLSGRGYRFHLYISDGTAYTRIEPEEAAQDLPVLFKPLGTPLPVPRYIASDADYVDYITELMGGFGVPAFVKTLRRGKRYLFIGLRLSRDTERMVMDDIIYGAAPDAGWAFLPEPTAKERKFLARHNITLIEDDFRALMEEPESLAC